MRYMGAAALLCVAASPLLLAASWRRGDDGRRPSTLDDAAALARVAIVVVPLVGYPLVVARRRAAPLSRPATSASCPVEGQPVDLVFGRFDDPCAAAELR